MFKPHATKTYFVEFIYRATYFCDMRDLIDLQLLWFAMIAAILSHFWLLASLRYHTWQWLCRGDYLLGLSQVGRESVGHAQRPSSSHINIAFVVVIGGSLVCRNVYQSVVR